jgi:putative Ca2+/H+ antiporter (TMEM165/GDT1 family)
VIPPDFITASVSTFSLVSLAEIGDKSQLVCMALATRHRHWPVLLGAASAFILLNILAVAFGASVASWIPESVLAGIVAILFLVFGIQALRAGDEDDDIEVQQKSNHGVFVTTFLMILVSEFGDKTQIAVAGLSTSLAAIPVWVGASLALIFISALGIWAGKALTGRVPLHWLHRAGGLLFLGFSGLAGYQCIDAIVGLSS